MGQVISWINSNLADDERQGEAREENKEPQSALALLNTLGPTAVFTCAYLFIFILTRRSQKRFYAPRAYLGSLSDHQRSPKLPDGLFRWINAFRKIPDVHALHHQSLDAYLFLRYLRICTITCAVSMGITWPLVLPVNATGGNGKSQLEMISYSNINIETASARLYAHVLAAWLVYGFVMYMITRECIFYINLRQAYLLSPRHAGRISARTVLFTCVPDEYLDEGRVRAVFGSAVRQVWFAGRSREIDRMVQRRDRTATLLEEAQVRYLRRVNRHYRKATRASETGRGEPPPPLPPPPTPAEGLLPPHVLEKLRPTRRAGFLGLVGSEVDEIAFLRGRLRTQAQGVHVAQAEWVAGSFEKASAVFVEFRTSTEAHTAFQLVTHHHGFRMAPKHIGVRPEEVIWANLGISWWRRVVSQYVVYAFVGALIVFWAIPVGIVGVVAQVSVIQSLPGLTWIGEIPEQILGVISGLLPSAALSLLMSLVPGIMASCARASGAATLAEVELYTQNAYFIFQLLQVFLIRTITDTAATAVVQIVQDPTSVFGTLAEALPTSSNFYISYFILQGFGIAVDVMTQVVSCVFFNIVYRFWATTPRRMYQKWTALEPVSWGSVMPVHTCIVVISVTYAVIAPFLLLWSTIAIWIFYQAYRYNVLFVSDTQANTHGLIYPRALKQLFAGVYIAEVCLIGILAVSRAPGQAVLMVLFLVFTVLYHITLGRALNPLLDNMPCTIQAAEDGLQMQASGDDASDTSKTMEEGIGSVPWAPGSSRPSHASPPPPPPPPRRAGMLQKFLRPWAFADYWALRELIAQGCAFDFEELDPEAEARAYLPPSVSNPAPELWLPQDGARASRREVAETRSVIPITDEGCTLDARNRIDWDMVEARPPIWREKVVY